MLDKLPPEFERIAELLEQQPPTVREVFHFMLTVAMEESGILTLEQRVFLLRIAEVYKTKGRQAGYMLHQGVAGFL